MKEQTNGFPISTLVKLWGLLWGPGSPVWLLGGVVLVSIVLLEAFHKTGFEALSSNLMIGGYAVVAQAIKFSTYLIALGLLMNYLAPKIQIGTKIIFEDSLAPELEKVNSKISGDLEGLNQRSVALLLRDSNEEQLAIATRELFERKYGSWIAHKKGFVQACLKIAEVASKEPYFRHNNNKIVCLKPWISPNFLRWIETNNYSVVRNLDDEDLSGGSGANPKHRVKYYTSVEINDSEEEVDAAISNFKFKLKRRLGDSKTYETLIEVNKDSFDVNGKEVRSVVSHMVVKKLERGGKVHLKLMVDYDAELTDRITYFSTKEESLIHCDDKSYTLTIDKPFRKGLISFEVPDGYTLSAYKLCTSSDWSPVDEHHEGSALTKLYSNTEEWVMPGLYFTVRWEKISGVEVCQ